MTNSLAVSPPSVALSKVKRPCLSPNPKRSRCISDRTLAKIRGLSARRVSVDIAAELSGQGYNVELIYIYIYIYIYIERERESERERERERDVREREGCVWICMDVYGCVWI
jgi:hypothetical protein